MFAIQRSSSLLFIKPLTTLMEGLLENHANKALRATKVVRSPKKLSLSDLSILPQLQNVLLLPKYAVIKQIQATVKLKERVFTSLYLLIRKKLIIVHNFYKSISCQTQFKKYSLQKPLKSHKVSCFELQTSMPNFQFLEQLIVRFCNTEYHTLSQPA